MGFKSGEHAGIPSNDHFQTLSMTKMLVLPLLNGTWYYHAEKSAYNAFAEERPPAMSMS